jgi:hypothetical protein
MEYPNPNWKAKAVKKFILSYYPQVENVEITYYTEDIPEIKVFFNQEDKRIPNEDWVLRQEIRKDVKDYFGKVYPKADDSSLQEISKEFVNDHKKKTYLAKQYPDLKYTDIELLSSLVTSKINMSKTFSSSSFIF